MSINSCSINAFTINSGRCRRPVIVPPTPVPVLGTNNSSVALDFAKRYPHLIRHSEHEIDDHLPLQFEQPFITVSAELMGQSGQQTIEAKQHLEFATVTDLNFDDANITVNISDISI